MLTSPATQTDLQFRCSLICVARLFSFVAMMSLLMPGISHATPIWNAVTDFSSVTQSGAWRYGQGTTGSTFTAYSNFNVPCDGFAGTSCWQPPVTSFGVPLVGINTTGSAFSAGTVVFPTDVLWVHPAVTDSIVQWTAPAAGTYRISGFFELLDITPTGVFVGIYDNSTLKFPASLLGAGATPPSTPGQRANFSLLLDLSANDVISFGVNSGGNLFDDSTGLAATIEAVPEPTSLGLLAGGLSGVFWLRRRRGPLSTRRRSH